MSGRLARQVRLASGTAGWLGLGQVSAAVCAVRVCVLSSHNDVQNMFPLETTRDPSHEVSIFLVIHTLVYSNLDRVCLPLSKSRADSPDIFDFCSRLL